MRVVKYFSYEVPFLKSESALLVGRFPILRMFLGIYEMRKNELKGIRTIQFARSAKYVLRRFDFLWLTIITASPLPSLFLCLPPRLLSSRTHQRLTTLTSQ